MAKKTCMDRQITDGRQARAIFNRLPKAEYIRCYDDGFVPNAYRWRAPGSGRLYLRNGKVTTFNYDRKRSHGRGPSWSAMNAAGSRIASH